MAFAKIVDFEGHHIMTGLRMAFITSRIPLQSSFPASGPTCYYLTYRKSSYGYSRNSQTIDDRGTAAADANPKQCRKPQGIIRTTPTIARKGPTAKLFAASGWAQATPLPSSHRPKMLNRFSSFLHEQVIDFGEGEVQGYIKPGTPSVEHHSSFQVTAIIISS